MWKHVAILALATAACTPEPLPPGVHFIQAVDDQPVAAQVLKHRERAEKQRATLLVYVSAPWCEPCVHFERAVEAGELADTLGDVHLLKYNRDVAEGYLDAAGYDSPMIPLFVVPEPNGRGSDTRMYGSIKGPGAVANIVPRLRMLLSATELEEGG